MRYSRQQLDRMFTPAEIMQTFGISAGMVEEIGPPNAYRPNPDDPAAAPILLYSAKRVRRWIMDNIEAVHAHLLERRRLATLPEQGSLSLPQDEPNSSRCLAFK